MNHWDKPAQPHFRGELLQHDEPERPPPQLPTRFVPPPDPYITNSQHANRPLPPTPRSSGSPGQAPAPVSSSQAAPQQPQRNSQNIMFKPVVSDNFSLILL